jgi:hypothetical protein
VGDDIPIKRKSGLLKLKLALKDKTLRAQINIKFRDVSSADESK